MVAQASKGQGLRGREDREKSLLSNRGSAGRMGHSADSRLEKIGVAQPPGPGE